MSDAPLVGIIMGSQSDWATMTHAAEMLRRLDIPHETRIVSAHRTPDRLRDYAQGARARGLRVVIAGAGPVVPVGTSHVTVRLAPGAGARLTLGMRRHAETPTVAFPWNRQP